MPVKTLSDLLADDVVAMMRELKPDLETVTVENIGHAPTLEEADEHCTRILEMAPYHFDLSHLQMESMDVLYYFDFLYQGNHDEVVAEALATGSPFESLTQSQDSFQ